MKKWALFLFLALILTASLIAARQPHALADGEVAAGEPETSDSAADLPLLVNAEFGLPDGYEPIELVDLYKQKRSFKLANSNIYVEAHVFEAMNSMFKAAKADGVKDFIVTSGYRTLKQQTKLYKADKKGLAAAPGHSEHETGLAFDVTAYGSEQFNKTPHFKWLKEHCWEYGFIIRYPKGKEDVTGIPYEPWHYRYVGVEHAMALKALGGSITLEEYNAAGGASGFTNQPAA